MDNDEVLAWRKLIRQKKLSEIAISRHCKMDLALYNGKIWKIQREKNYSPLIHALIYYYGYRNGK